MFGCFDRQVASAGSKLGEVGICRFKMLLSEAVSPHFAHQMVHGSRIARERIRFASSSPSNSSLIGSQRSARPVQ